MHQTRKLRRVGKETWVEEAECYIKKLQVSPEILAVLEEGPSPHQAAAECYLGMANQEIFFVL
jgi:hypothetical protein